MPKVKKAAKSRKVSGGFGKNFGKNYPNTARKRKIMLKLSQDLTKYKTLVYTLYMDSQSQQRLQTILQKHESSLTEVDLAFIKSRRMYLSRTQRKDYADIFKDKGREDWEVFLENMDTASQGDEEVRPRKGNKTQYEDKDVRLNLDQPAAQQPQQAAAQPQQPAQPEQPQVQVNTQPAQQPANNNDGIDHSLDPDYQPNQ